MNIKDNCIMEYIGYIFVFVIIFVVIIIITITYFFSSVNNDQDILPNPSPEPPSECSNCDIITNSTLNGDGSSTNPLEAAISTEADNLLTVDGLGELYVPEQAMVCGDCPIVADKSLNGDGTLADPLTINVFTTNSISGNGTSINPLLVDISTDPDNSITYGTDGKLWSQDLTQYGFALRKNGTMDVNIADGEINITEWTTSSAFNFNDGIISLSGGKYASPVDGTYNFSITLELSGANPITGGIKFGIAVNNILQHQAIVDTSVANFSDTVAMSVSGDITLKVGDIVSFRIENFSGTDPKTVGVLSRITAHRIR